MTRKYILPILLTAMAGSAQEVYVTGIDGTTLTADVENLQGKTIANVLTRTYYMPTGESTSLSAFAVNGSEITADIDRRDGDYFYRVEVTFADGTAAKSDCYNAAMTQTAVWLSDLTPTSASGNAVTNDLCANGATMVIDNVNYAKGVSIQATGWAEYALPRTFDYVQFVMGLQDCLADGSASTGFARIITSVNGSETNWKANMYAKTNPSRGNAVCKFVARYPNAGNASINTFRFTANDANSNNADDYCNLGAVRFYSAIPKRPQRVEFVTPGGFIPDSKESVVLEATSSRGMPVSYAILQGADLATLQGNVLTPHEGKRGTITVEARAEGNNLFETGAAQLTFSFNRSATVEYLATYPIDETQQMVYVYVDPRDKNLGSITLDIYNDPRGFILQGSKAVGTAHATRVPMIYAVTTPAGTVHQLKYQFEGDEEVTEPYAEGMSQYAYMSDLPYAITTGWGQATTDRPYSGAVGQFIETKTHTYSKGFGTHAAGSVTATGDLTAFDRFVADVGGQMISNTARGKLNFVLKEGNVNLASTGNVAWTEVTEWDVPITGRSAIKIEAGVGGDGNQNDVVAIGAPRFYYRTSRKLPQSVVWPAAEEKVDYYKPFALELKATATSGLPVFYRIAQGSEYAEIVDGTTLQFNHIVSGGDVVVEAVQPGNKEYAAAEASRCRFVVNDRLIVKRDERVEIDGNQDVDELIVYADARSAGQVVVKDGVSNVKKLIVKYTFVPGQWTHISFPSSVNLDEISDLNAKGYRLGNGYELRSYNSRTRSRTPDNSPWEDMASANVTAQMGYIFRLDDSMGTDPQEITFEITNVALNLDSGLGDVHLNLDMTHCEPGAMQSVYVKAGNVKSNVLKVNVLFRPDDESLLPVNHAKALENMRITFTPNRKGLRFTLPDQTPARVALFSEDGTELIKAVRYVAPMVMDIADVAPGTYRLVINYGPASTLRTISF